MVIRIHVWKGEGDYVLQHTGLVLLTRQGRREQMTAIRGAGGDQVGGVSEGGREMRGGKRKLMLIRGKAARL
jgi:hypothetical protein